VIYYVTVGVALKRPPTVQECRKYAVEAEDSMGAMLEALLMASCTSVMPVSATVTGDEEVGDGE
jgi:hypothetical protein